MVQTAMDYADKTPSKAIKLSLLETLNKVTDGKIYVEIERSRIARMQAQLLEAENKLIEACEVLQDVQIETIGSMEAPEKIDFILYHFRLTLDSKDFIRALIISRKITERSLSISEHQDLKIEYYKLMIRYHTEKKSWIDIAKAYLSIYDTPKIKSDEKVFSEILTNVVLFLILQPKKSIKTAFFGLFQKKKTKEGDKYAHDTQEIQLRRMADLFNPQHFDVAFKQYLLEHPVFKVDPTRWQELHNRIVENNIRVISVYYTKVHMKRLATLLHLDEQTTEDFVSKMVQKKIIVAKIDRIDGIVIFLKSKEANDVLNSWSNDTNSLLGYVEKSVHLINKEMVAKVVKKDVMDLVE
jgi:26S proteasome regulatory subunit N5